MRERRERMERRGMTLKKLGVWIFVGAVLLTAIDYCTCQAKERRWSFEWRKTPDCFQLSATKRKPSRRAK